MFKSLSGSFGFWSVDGIIVVYRVKDNVCDLIIAADYYGFSSVLTDCSKFLIKLLTISSCISIWSFSNDFNLSEVEEAAFDYILRHFVKVRDLLRSYILILPFQIYKTVSAFIVLPEPMFNRLIMSEWLNADEREINEATEIWQKHRNIKSVGKSTENVGVLQEPIEETMKKLRNFLDFIELHTKIPHQSVFGAYPRK